MYIYIFKLWREIGDMVGIINSKDIWKLYRSLLFYKVFVYICMMCVYLNGVIIYRGYGFFKSCIMLNKKFSVFSFFKLVFDMLLRAF